MSLLTRSWQKNVRNVDIYNIRPILEPCGSPTELDLRREVLSFILTGNCVFDRNDLIMFEKYVGVSTAYSLYRRASIHTLLNTFDLSTKNSSSVIVIFNVGYLAPFWIFQNYFCEYLIPNQSLLIFEFFLRISAHFVLQKN